jgi:hypothetical protein
MLPALRSNIKNGRDKIMYEVLQWIRAGMQLDAIEEMYAVLKKNMEEQGLLSKNYEALYPVYMIFESLESLRKPDMQKSLDRMIKDMEEIYSPSE